MRESGRQSSSQNAVATQHSSQCVMLHDRKLVLQCFEDNEERRCITFTKICMAKGLQTCSSNTTPDQTASNHMG